MANNIKLSVDLVIPVRNNAALICNCLSSIFSQQTDLFELKEVIVVDDASTDNTVELIKEKFAARVTIIELEENQGRSGARNIGAKHGKGKIIIFLDSDCNFTSDTAIESHVKKIESGCDVSCGAIAVSSDYGFWRIYTKKIMAKRERKAIAGDFSQFVTANFAIKRKVFIDHGGFNLKYRHYGFEDRDLIIRLIKNDVPMCYTPESGAEHVADFSLDTIARKMWESGAYSAPLFASDHPEYYARMGYSRLDVRLNHILRTPARWFIAPIFPTIVKISSKIIKSNLWANEIKIIVVKIVSAFAFMLGTMQIINSVKQYKKAS